jgi:hypothetical protein
MKSTVKVELSSRPLIVNNAGPTMRKKPAIAASLPRVLTSILKTDPLSQIVEPNESAKTVGLNIGENA